MYLVTSAEMKEIDRQAIEEYEVSAPILMENAGINTLMAMQQAFGQLYYRRVYIFCRAGNNGGDGMVLARHLKNEGALPKIFFIGGSEGLSVEAKENLNRAINYGVEVISINTEDDIEKNSADIMSCDITVDAMIGTGLKKDVAGITAKIIVFLNALGKPCVAVDIPSGVDSDTGIIRGVAINAALTVTFGLPKIGTTIYPGIGNTGKLVVSDISFPNELLTKPRKNVLITGDMAVPLLPYRGPNSNKGNFGPILIVGGSPGMSGAVTMTAKAALKSGAGVVTVCVPESLQQTVKSRSDEVITAGLPETKKGFLSKKAGESIMALAEKAKVVILGPGMGRDPEPQELVRELVERLNTPLLIDADGLNAVSEDKKCLKNIKKDAILTPHIGEMARLVGTQIENVIKNKIKILREFAGQYPVNVLLKDGRSMIMDTDMNLYVNTTGNSGMATPGAGDVLSGLIGAFMAHGIMSTQAGIAGNYVHGLAGDLLLSEMSEEGITASDIINAIPRALKNLKTQEA